MDIGVPHMAGCAEDKVANAKLLKVKKSFFMEIASSMSDVSVCKTNRGTWLKEGSGSSFNPRPTQST